MVEVDILWHNEEENVIEERIQCFLRENMSKMICLGSSSCLPGVMGTGSHTQWSIRNHLWATL